MKFSAVAMTLLAASFALPLSAQNGTPGMKEAVVRSYDQIKTNLTKAAEEMPEADYDFRPTKDVRNFGGWVAHVADAQTGICSGIMGSPKKGEAASKTSKADLVAALKESFDTCDEAYKGLTEQNQVEPVPFFRGQLPRLVALENNIAHDNECYGSMAVYMRLKGLVPPSTAAMKQMQHH